MEAKASVNFKKNAAKAVWAIVLFILTYLFLFTLVFLFAALCITGGICVFMLRPGFISLLVGMGVGILGLSVLIFLIKFLFKKHRSDTTHYAEIVREQEPKLFGIIDDVVGEIKVGFPKKVYLSEDVNAGVFYDSSFWSMFIPVPKNLNIGLGLINSVTVQEFKSILAHEFGHFSQKSMKIGSYVYNVNMVIHNMLYDNESFEKAVRHWAQISGIFSFFVWIAAMIIRGIQWVLLKLYDYLNVKYLALSREMEFNADEVAANITGYMPVKEALLRTDLSKYAYDVVLNFYEGKIPENKKSKNIYREHQFVMNFLAEDMDIPMKNGFPLVSGYDLNKYNRSKLNIKDQWVSHPTTAERIMALEKQGVEREYDSKYDKPAVSLLTGAEETEQKMTEKLFEKVSYKEEPSFLSYEDFIAELSEVYLKNFPDIYNDYYNDRNPALFDPENIVCEDSDETIGTLFSKTAVERVYNSLGLENDIHILNDIAGKIF